MSCCGIRRNKWEFRLIKYQVYVKKEGVHIVLSQCIVRCDSTNYTAFCVTGYLEDPSTVVVDEFLR